MFNFVSRWLINRRRKIFKYWDGVKWQYTDPLKVWRAIMTHPTFDPESTGPAFDRGDEEAWKTVLGISQDVFHVVPFVKPGQLGLTEQETILVFKRFLVYCDDLKKSIRTIPTTQPPTPVTDQTEYSVPPEVEALMKDIAASGSTLTANSSETPGCC